MIEFIDVTKSYDGDAPAVENVSLRLPARSITVLVGSSGSGKTTLLRMVNRMVDPTSGRVEIDGEDVAARPPVALRRGIGYVPQHSGLLPHRRVIDNIATVPLLNGEPKAAAHRRASELMDVVGLDASLAGRYPAQLSGGQQQRVAVARALAGDPNILLMDEPFGAVDPIVRAELQQETLRLQHELRKTIVFVTHDIDEAFLLGDEVVILRRGGRVAQRGTPADILADPVDAFVAAFIGSDRGRRRLTISSRRPTTGADRVVVDAGGYPVGVIAAPAGQLAAGDPTPRSRGTRMAG
ncbi:ATP-binding cassette domain-containing protein [Jiangella mangrovi]|uniref:ABC-type quaternary amine transporter n=1 Tax=Jiangella mangrovi TaxID=1524084 RepID=A0A7W9GR74_9ACTN|nr:osmoprotectant transport system ATP-binding protein [Jiangella mangrovi]